MPHVVNWQDRQLIRDGQHIAGAVWRGWFVKIVQGSKHRLRNRPGGAVDAAALAVARTLGARGLRIEDTESGRVYLADLATLDAHGYRLDAGWGEQIALDMKFWQTEGAPAPLVQEPLFA